MKGHHKLNQRVTTALGETQHTARMEKKRMIQSREHPRHTCAGTHMKSCPNKQARHLGGLESPMINIDSTLNEIILVVD